MTSLSPSSPDPTPALPALPQALARSLPQQLAASDRALLEACYVRLESMRGANGLYLASPSADYSKAWLRDNFYEVLPYVDKPTPHHDATWASLMEILRRHEWKIDAIIRKKPTHRDEYIHARFDPVTFREIDEPWGNKQNDATGALLFGIAKAIQHDKRVLRTERDVRLVRKLIRMHGALRYWDDPDNGIWEEYEEVHASSIGAVVAGLRAIRQVGFDVPQELIDRGQHALDRILPRESKTKRTDLALLTLIYPYRVVTPEQRDRILRDVEKRLLRERGVIRYEGDSYYSPDRKSVV